MEHISLIENFSQQLDAVLASGIPATDLIPNNGKAPVDLKWTDHNEVNYSEQSLRKAVQKSFNIGYRIPAQQLIVDCDPKNGGRESWTALCDKVPDLLRLFETTLTPSGGFHLYLTLPVEYGDGIHLAKNLKEFPGLDFLKLGNQAIIIGQGPNGKFYEQAPHAQLQGQAIPPALYQLLKDGSSKVESLTHSDGEAREKFYQRNGWGILKPGELKGLLDRLNPEKFREYTVWFSIMASCHFSSAGEAEDVFTAWSALDPLYGDQSAKVAKHWASLSKEGSSINSVPITAMSLVHIFNDAGMLDQVNFIGARLKRRLQGEVSFDAVDGATDTDVLQKWLDDLSTYTDESKIISEFMMKLAESPDLLPAQREVVFQKMKDRTGVGLGTLREDFKAHSAGVGAFLDGQSEQRDTTTQSMVMVSSIAKLGGRELFMHCQGDFFRWKGQGYWETENDTSVQQMVMSVMEELNFPAMTAGAISSINKMIQIQVYREEDIWELGDQKKGKYEAQDAPVINLMDGELKLDMASGEWALEAHKPQSYRRVLLPLSYEQGLSSECPVWDKFIDESLWCTDDLELETRKTQLATFIIYTMIESMPWLKKCVYLFGKPDSGKSVILDVVGEMLGEGNTSSLNITQLGSQFSPAGLSGKLANMAGEIARGELIADGPFKSMISGDSIMVERKGENGYSFQNKAVFWFAGNNLPRSRDKSGAIESRMLYLPFDWTVPPERRDTDLRAKLVAEKDAIFSWALERFTAEHVKDKCVHILNVETAGMRKVMAEFKEASSPARVWFQDNVLVIWSGCDLVAEKTPGVKPVIGTVKTTVKDLYDDYAKWCKANNHPALTKEHLSTEISSIVKELASEVTGEERGRFINEVKRTTKSRPRKTRGGSSYQKKDRAWLGLDLFVPYQFDEVPAKGK